MLTNTNNVNRYLINGTPLATYSISFPYWDKEEIKVYLTNEDGTLETLVENTNYTLSAPNGNDGTLTRVGDWTAGATNLTIVREMNLTQEVDLRNGDKIDAETVERSFDTVTAQIQQLAEQQTRSMQSSIDEAGSAMVIPNATARAGSGSGTIMGFGPSGDSIELRDLAQFDTDVQNTADNASSAHTDATAAGVYKEKAKAWASKFDDDHPDDTEPVEDGNYSAKKYAYDANVSEAFSTESRYKSEGFATGTVDGAPVPNTSPYYHNNSKYFKEQADATFNNKVDISDIVDNTSTQVATRPLSANMGYELKQQILNLQARGRFLSLWNCLTGLPETDPVEIPYAYKAGDYYIVSHSVFSMIEITAEYDDTADYAVDDYTVHQGSLFQCNTPISGGETWDPTHWDEITNNYIPNGSSYTGIASTTTSPDEIKANDFYWYDGTTWLLLNNTSKTLTFANIAGDPMDNAALEAAFDKTVKHENDVPASAIPVNADQLNGHADTYFATASALNAISDKVTPNDISSSVTESIGKTKVYQVGKIVFVSWQLNGGTLSTGSNTVATGLPVPLDYTASGSNPAMPLNNAGGNGMWDTSFVIQVKSSGDLIAYNGSGSSLSGSSRGSYIVYVCQ